ncbi:MAG: glycine cleavage system protein GcvH [Acidimicrobiia bacterium]
MQVASDRRYSQDHEWALMDADGRVRVGISDFAQDALGDIVYVELPEVGSSFGVGDSMCEVESTKSVSDVFAPVAGTVEDVNAALTERPELLNADPYGEGWIAVIAPSEPDQYGQLMDATAYEALTAGA